MPTPCRRHFLNFTAVVALFCTAVLPAKTVTSVQRALDITLAPVIGAGNSATGISVHYVLSPPKGPADALALTFDTLAPSLLRTSDQVTLLHVVDDKGNVVLAPPVVKQMNGGSFQVWSAARPTSGALHVSYVVPVAAAKPSKRGPHIDLQAAGGGLSGAFVGFLLLPDNRSEVFRVHLHWQLPARQMAVSSNGVGDFSGEFNASRLDDMLFLVGPVKTYAPSGNSNGFNVYALGLSEEQLKAAASWTARAYEVERKAFRIPPSKPYRFLIRSYDGGPIDSGRSSDSSFMLYLPTGFDAGRTDLHSLVAHEMVHSLMKDFDDAPGDEGDWYTEGTADYFSQTLPWAARLYTARQYLDLVNEEAAEYYTNALRDVSNKQLAEVMWSGRNAWMLPYARGALYFADLDAKLRLHHSSLTVLDLVNATSEQIEHGAPATDATWTAMLKNKVGTWALTDWQNMMDGQLIMPAPGAFGTCLIGNVTRVGIFNLGFSKPIRVMANETVSGVVKRSNADKAGLRDGDVITETIDINPIAGSFDSLIHLSIRRGASPMMISYNPRSGLVPGMRWHLSSADAQQKCSH
jgi:predicted metalloprotease with PDZ domain